MQSELADAENDGGASASYTVVKASSAISQHAGGGSMYTYILSVKGLYNRVNAFAVQVVE